MPTEFGHESKSHTHLNSKTFSTHTTLPLFEKTSKIGECDTILFGGDADVIINAGRGPDEIHPGLGNNFIHLTNDGDTLIGEGGNDNVDRNSGIRII